MLKEAQAQPISDIIDHGAKTAFENIRIAAEKNEKATFKTTFTMNENIGNSGSGSSTCPASPFGVKLKSPIRRAAAAAAEMEQQQQKHQRADDTIITIHKRLQEDEAAEQKLSQQRNTLRKVPGPSPSIVRR